MTVAMAKSPREILHTARLLDALLFWPVLIFVVWGELEPHVPKALSEINDKVLHFGAYFLLGAMAGAAVKRREPVIWAVLGLSALGAILEVIQGYVGRQSSLFDELTNAVGVSSGASLARFVVEPLRRRWAGPLEAVPVQALRRPSPEL